MRYGERSAIVTSIAKAVYDLLTEKSTALSAQTEGPSTHPQATEPAADSNDASVVHVTGFALHSAIRCRRKPLPQKSRHSSEALQELQEELHLLEPFGAFCHNL